MNKRALTVFGLAAALVLGACGSDTPSAMSDDEFADAMIGLCEDAQDGIDETASPSLDDFDAVADHADDAMDAIAEMIDALSSIVPPADSTKDFQRFVRIVRDEADAVEALQEAADDEDLDAVSDASDDLFDLASDRGDVAEDIDDDFDACRVSFTVPQNPVAPGDPTVPTDPSVPVSDPVVPTDPVPTDPTLPVTTLPVTTLPSVTLPVVTLPTVPETAPPSPEPAGGSIEITTIADLYAPPAGYTLVDRETAAVQGFVDVVASFPTLSASVAQLGVADVLDAAGNQAATLVIAVTYDGIDTMPSDWTLVLCDPATSSTTTSPGGQSGTSCPGTAESGIVEAFTLEMGPYGFSVVTFDAAISAVALADEFATANS